jgi:nucleotide-binding universal stress UspA family protein
MSPTKHVSERRRLLICFDGSESASTALAAAAHLFPSATATVAYIWQPLLPYGGVNYGGTVILPPEFQRELEEKATHDAELLAARGTELARNAGLDARAAVRETKGPVWKELLAVADDSDADLIVAGSRGRGEVTALVFGSTSQALAHHTRRPLLLVPPRNPD